MALQDEFANDLPRFLKEHAVCVNGGSVQNLVGGGTIGAGIAAQGIQTTQKVAGGAAKAGVSLAAPLFSPTFAQTRDAENADLLDFSRPMVTVNLGATSPPAWRSTWMPYEGGSARGIRLPAHGSDPYNVAYAMTATLNGCTVEISGTPASPYASHTNVIDVTDNDAARKWFAREQKINARLFRLQQTIRGRGNGDRWQSGRAGTEPNTVWLLRFNRRRSRSRGQGQELQHGHEGRWRSSRGSIRQDHPARKQAAQPLPLHVRPDR